MAREGLVLSLENALTDLHDAEAESQAEVTLLPEAIDAVEALLAEVRKTDGLEG
jgi:predicted  nucleic acid-binding Zn-ribbon protein